ncbi:Glyoxalase/Bleomycin resistance protein/Dihydroxybiphenyl dioxygenase [Xylariales sp. PMI_506]|nr:Glyoxalase/Bleomycin resistance protein/Dihydroxybiphenyl dioxygenase [Xylariales sp. PMI_506]
MRSSFFGIVRTYSRPPLSRTFNRAYAARTMSSIANVRSLDHLVLTVKDLQSTIKFYETVLGMKHTVFVSKGDERHALIFGQQKINLHVSGKEFEPKAQTVQPGSADLCFLVEDNVDEVAERLRARSIEILEGGDIVPRTGAKAKLRSVYVRDPDGNLIELSNETA